MPFNDVYLKNQFRRSPQTKALLLTKEKNVCEVACEVGFDDSKYFSRIFTEEFGVPPSKV